MGNYIRNDVVWAEMARRKKQFHASEEWDKIKLWGLYSYSSIGRFIKSGELLTHMNRENGTVWVTPSREAYHKHIEPLLNKPLDELTKLAGWS